MTRQEQRAEKAAKNKAAALAAFIAKKSEIETALARLTDLAENHFDTDPDGIDWGHVGTLDDYASKLKQITDSAFNEGENA